MKLVIILLALCIFSIKSFAQLESNTFLFGGGLSAYTNHEEIPEDFIGSNYETELIGMSIFPEIGYFVIDNFVLGVNSKISIEGQTTDYIIPDFPNTNSTTFEYLFGPYVRYYIPIKPFALFAELNYQFGKINETYEFYEFEENKNVERKNIYDSWLLAPKIGAEYFINSSIGIVAAIRYETREEKINHKNQDGQSDYQIDKKNNGFLLVVALQVHLNFNN